ncbi:MAG: purine-binding chemotaxis protein CheW [Roseburia sp.]|jgi:purine-binding chemotaxis protein CheW|nr:purine-binding chemotaxis protein CheW [Roseburia sp.]
MANKALEVIEKQSKQYIVVMVGNEQYGIDISYIDNIVRMQKITRVPRIQPYFNGIINLRGEIVSVMSIRKKMGLEEDVFTHSSRIIILKIEEKGALGIIVDEVREVVNLSEDEIEKVSNKGRFINGIGTHGDELISLLEINAIVDEGQ